MRLLEGHDTWKTTRLSPKLIHFILIRQIEIRELNKQLQEYKFKDTKTFETFAGAKNTLFKLQSFSVVLETSHPNHEKNHLNMNGARDCHVADHQTALTFDNMIRFAKRAAAGNRAAAPHV